MRTHAMWPFRRRTDADFRHEIEAHLAIESERLIAEGLSPDEARRAASRRFGNVTAARERYYDSRRILWIDDLRQDLRQALRACRKTPAFTAIAVVTLAFGIGANTAIFSLVEAVLLRTLPVRAPHELFFIAHTFRDEPTTQSNYPLFERMRARTDVFAGVTAYTQGTVFKVAHGDVAEMTQGQFVSGNYHGVLGVPMTLGRGFTSDDGRGDGGGEGPAAVISHAYWTRRFARDPDVLGRPLVVDGRTVSIVGVTAPGFDGLESGLPRDITLPLAVHVLGDAGFPTRHDGWTSMPIVARLAPGVSASQAAAVAHAVFHEYLLEPPNQWYRAASPREPVAHLASAARGSERVRREYARALGVLMAIVAVVLLIGCVNLANLLLARGAARAREVAVRLSLGAGRWRLIRQFLTESLLLAVIGGALGLFLALWGARSIAAFFDVGRFPVILEVQANALVLAFTAGVSVLAALVFGVAPAFGATRIQPGPVLKEGRGAGTRPRRWHARQVLVVGQIALCVLLVAGAGLLVRTLHNLQTRDFGIAREKVLVASLAVRGAVLPDGGLARFCEQLIERVATGPGAIAGACSTSVPADSRGSTRGLQRPGIDSAPDASAVWSTMVSSGYFRTFGLTLLRGRTLTDQDAATSPRVAVVSESLARHHFGDEDPIGHVVHWRGRPEQRLTIVGVVRDTLQDSVRAAPRRTIYTPLAQSGGASPSSLYAAIRTATDPVGLTWAVRTDAVLLNRDVVVESVRTLEAQIDAMLVREHVIARLSAWFGLLALLLACVGLYGVMSYDVGRRVRDIGIRIALGAHPSTVQAQMLRQTAVLAGLGILVGLGAAMATTSVLATLLYGLTPRDPVTLTTAAALLAVTSLMAGYLPARRAARIDPIAALRAE